MPPIPPADFARVRQDFGSLEAAAEACGVTVKQVRRWESGVSSVPRAAYRLLQLLGTRELGAMDSAWAGWRLTRAGLASPEGEVYERTWFYALKYHLGSRDAREAGLRRQIRRLGTLIGALMARPRRERAPVQLRLTWDAPPSRAPDNRPSPPAAGRPADPPPRAPTDRRRRWAPRAEERRAAAGPGP